MSEIWKFSPSLSEQLQLCIAAARKDEQNKWYQEFGHLTRNHSPNESFYGEKVYKTPKVIEKSLENNYLDHGAKTVGSKNEKTSELGAENFEELIESVESEFSTRVDFIIEECVKNSNLLHMLALKLSENSIEKLCNHICDKKDISKDFTTKYFECFLPNYIKRSYNSGTLDILVKSHKKFPLQFKLLLQKLIKDIEIPKQVLQSFVESLNEEDCSNFIITLSEFDLSSDEFSNRLLAIYTAYQSCKKSEQVQMYLQSMLIQHSSFCVTDRHYGRLLLTFLQTQKSLKLPLTNVSIENIIETHRSPFKRPCVTLLKELMGDYDVNESSSEEDSE